MKKNKKGRFFIFENASLICVLEKLCDQGKMTCGLWKTIKESEFKTRN
jgi:hypothetical protein